MDISGTPQDSDRCSYSRFNRYCTCRHGRAFWMVTCTNLLRVRQPDADCRQLYQWPFWLPQRDGQGRPPGAWTRLWARLDFSSGNENGNHRHGYPCLPHRLYAAFLCGVGADYRRRSLCTFCFSLYNRTLSPILQRLGRCFSNHFFRFCPRRWNLLCASANMDAGCYRSLTRLRTAHWHFTCCQ